MRKKRILALILAVCFTILLCPVTALADSDLFFSAANDTLLSYNAGSAPIYYGGTLYLPYTLFTMNGFGIYYSTFSEGNIYCLYSVENTVFFDLDNGDSFNAEGEHFAASAIYYGGLLYVPAYFTCGQFGLSCSVLTSAPAPIARITSGSAAYSNSAFISAYSSQIQAVIDSMTTPDTPTVDPDPEIKPDEKDYSDVTLFLGFIGIQDGGCKAVLDVLKDYGMRACFFVSVDDILAAADDIRHICGSGHSIGIYLEDGSQEEYVSVSELLFEAAMATTLSVTSGPDAEDAARDTARRNGLVFRAVDGVCDSGFTAASAASVLATSSGSRQLVLLDCYDGAADELRGLLRYILDAKYSVGYINEVTVISPEID
ncbi:MAG: hypothetical protein J5569_05090 [Oscillospiraceae bacterium]|nr:hypothetical protein [Oscillospiraceae bacterium]